MNKLCKSLFLVCVMVITFTMVDAVAKDDLISYINQEHIVAGETITLTAYQKTQVERYLNSYTVKDSQVSIFKSKVEEIKSIINTANVIDFNKLTASDKSKIINLVKDAGTSVGITVIFNNTNNCVEIYNSSGVILDVFSLNQGKLPFTGTNTLFYPITIVTTIIIAMIYALKKGLLEL